MSNELKRVLSATERRFKKYVNDLASALGHADRVAPFGFYTMGLLLPGDRKSVEPMAARLSPERVRAAHQSLHHFVAQAEWSDRALLAKVYNAVLPAIERHGQITTWIVDDTGIPKKGSQSVGVAHQYCGQVGKQANCQVAVTLSIANEFASLPIAHRLYLSKEWAEDRERRTKAGVPSEIRFATKPQIALEQIRQAKTAGIVPGVIVSDAAYGNDTAFRDGITDMGLNYIVSVQSSTTVWRTGEAPLEPRTRKAGRGRRRTLLRRTARHAPVALTEIATELPASAFCMITWREGTQASLESRFAAVRVRPAHRDTLRSIVRAEEWLLIEWPEGEGAPRKYWLANLPASTTRPELVQLAQSRWRIERDYQELKDELGLGHYEGRSWRGFHHHATLCIAAYGFLIAERGAFSPSRDVRSAFKQSALPNDFRPRGYSRAS
ncbi:MAG: IS701 family transposase [Vulcanimicrobiaceae bacterium]